MDIRTQNAQCYHLDDLGPSLQYREMQNKEKFQKENVPNSGENCKNDFVMFWWRKSIVDTSVHDDHKYGAWVYQLCSMCL